MDVLHLTAHLGGGVGKAHAALRAAMPEQIHQTYLLLEDPRDRRYADEITASGGTVIVARDLADVAECCASADIVQFEFWNHPKLFEALAHTDFPNMRSVFWAHVSGLFRPVIASGLLTAADRFVFTTPASMVLGEGLGEEDRHRLSSIGSGFGFSATIAQSGNPPTRPGSQSIAYLGTVDFIKMHPGFFEAIDTLAGDVAVAVWGAHDLAGEVAARAAAMRHPGRIRFMGQTTDPRAALMGSRIFFYPLQPDHYGTAENALIEAMSLGLVPVVLANPAECAIVEHEVTGFACRSIEDCVSVLERLLASPRDIAVIGRNAAAKAARQFTPERSAHAFVELWSSLMASGKHAHEFAAIVGGTPLDWYRATQALPDDKSFALARSGSGQQSKGTLAHFQSEFPDDPCWATT